MTRLAIACLVVLAAASAAGQGVTSALVSATELAAS
jgi:hypothetical protein